MKIYASNDRTYGDVMGGLASTHLNKHMARGKERTERPQGSYPLVWG